MLNLLCKFTVIFPLDDVQILRTILVVRSAWRENHMNRLALSRIPFCYLFMCPWRDVVESFCFILFSSFAALRYGKHDRICCHVEMAARNATDRFPSVNWGFTFHCAVNRYQSNSAAIGTDRHQREKNSTAKAKDIQCIYQYSIIIWEFCFWDLLRVNV